MILSCYIKHQPNNSLLWLLDCHGNHSHTSITPLPQIEFMFGVEILLDVTKLATYLNAKVGILSAVLLRTTVLFVTAHLEIFHCTHRPVIPKSDLYFIFSFTLNALSERTSS